jgi:hypothetical protein
MAEFVSLQSALEPWFETPLDALPADIRDRVQRDMSPFDWDYLSPGQRKKAARAWDERHDPKAERASQLAWELVVRSYNLEREITRWHGISAPTGSEVAQKHARLEELQQQLDQTNWLLEHAQLVSPAHATTSVSQPGPRPPPKYLPFPAAINRLRERLATNEHELAAWIFMGPENGGIAAYRKTGELHPPPRFLFDISAGWRAHRCTADCPAHPRARQAARRTRQGAVGDRGPKKSYCTAGSARGHRQAREHLMAAALELTPTLGAGAACRAMGLGRGEPARQQARVHRRTVMGPPRPRAPRPCPPLALDANERQTVLDTLNSERFADTAPAPCTPRCSTKASTSARCAPCTGYWRPTAPAASGATSSPTRPIPSPNCWPRRPTKSGPGSSTLPSLRDPHLQPLRRGLAHRPARVLRARPAAIADTVSRHNVEPAC